MRKFIITVLVVLCAMALIACGAPGMQPGQRPQQQPQQQPQDPDMQQEGDMTAAEEQMVEEMMEDMMGDDVDIEIDDGGDTVTIEGGDGEDIVIAEGQGWPAEMPPSVPPIQGVKIVGTMMAEGGGTVVFEGCNKQIGEGYINELKAAGWDITTTMESEGMHIYMAQNNMGEFLQVTWEDDSGDGGITFGNAE